MYCRMLDAMLSNGQEDENGILFICFPVTAIAAVLSRSPMTVKRSLNELETAGLKQDHVEYLLDVLLFGETEEKAALITDYGKDVIQLEQRMALKAAQKEALEHRAPDGPKKKAPDRGDR